MLQDNWDAPSHAFPNSPLSAFSRNQCTEVAFLLKFRTLWHGKKQVRELGWAILSFWSMAAGTAQQIRSFIGHGRLKANLIVSGIPSLLKVGLSRHIRAVRKRARGFLAWKLEPESSSSQETRGKFQMNSKKKLIFLICTPLWAYILECFKILR